MTLGEGFKLGRHQMCVANARTNKVLDTLYLEDFTDKVCGYEVTSIEAVADIVVYWISVDPVDYPALELIEIEDFEEFKEAYSK